MNQEVLCEILNASAADGWKIIDEKREGWEFYFIRHNLDQNRIRNTRHVNVTVYKHSADGKDLGSASREIMLSESEEKVAREIAGLIHEASLIHNPAYSLPQPSEEDSSTMETVDVKDIAKNFIETMMDLPETSTEDVNSYEIFCDSVTRRVVTSTGIDVTSRYPSSMIEVVVNARKDDHEIELYRMYHSGTCDRQTLKSEISETLRYGKDRLHTTATPQLQTFPVVFSTDAALQIYDWFIARMNAAYVYQRISDWKINEPISSDIIGDKVSVKAVRTLENSSCNTRFDSDGRRIDDLVIIDQDVPVHYYGSSQYGQYLGLKDSFVPGNWVVSGGTKSAAEIRSEDYLEVVEFSDFQVSPINGDIAGEIRLGYLHQNGKVTAVSGGSVSGTMNDFVKNMHMSREQKQYNNMLIPAVTRLENARITGAE